MAPHGRRRRGRSTPTSSSARSACSANRCAPEVPGTRALRRHDVPLRRLGRRPRPHRRAGRGHRERRRARCSSSPRSHRSSAQLDRVPALRELGARPRRTTPTPRTELAAFAADLDCGAGGRATRSSPPSIPTSPSPTPSGGRWPRASAPRNIQLVEDEELRARAHARHAVRVQAAAGVERLLPHVQPAARRAGHRRRSPRSPSTASSPPTARTREVDTIILATGFTTTKFLAALDVIGRNGVDIDDAWADGAAGVPRHHHRRLPEPVHAVRPEHQQRVDHLHDRVPGRLRHGRCSTPWTSTTSPWVDVKRDVMDEYNVERPASARRRRGVAGRVQRLLPGRRSHRHAVAGFDERVPQPHRAASTSTRSRPLAAETARRHRVASAHGRRRHHPPHRSLRVTRVGARVLHHRRAAGLRQPVGRRPPGDAPAHRVRLHARAQAGEDRRRRGVGAAVAQLRDDDHAHVGRRLHRAGAARHRGGGAADPQRGAQRARPGHPRRVLRRPGRLRRRASAGCARRPRPWACRGTAGVPAARSTSR